MTAGARQCLLCAALCVPGLARGDEVFLGEAQAPVALFGPGVAAERAELVLSPGQLELLGRAVGKRVDQKEYSYLRVHRLGDPAPVGVIFLLDVVGQSLPIRFAVGVNPDRTLRDVQVMVYREPYGKEINERRFRAQFKGKDAKAPLLVGKDIQAISGATISSGSATYAARKALALAPFVPSVPAGP